MVIVFTKNEQFCIKIMLAIRLLLINEGGKGRGQVLKQQTNKAILAHIDTKFDSLSFYRV